MADRVLLVAYTLIVDSTLVHPPTICASPAVLITPEQAHPVDHICSIPLFLCFNAWVELMVH